MKLIIEGSPSELRPLFALLAQHEDAEVVVAANEDTNEDTNEAPVEAPIDPPVEAMVEPVIEAPVEAPRSAGTVLILDQVLDDLRQNGSGTTEAIAARVGLMPSQVGTATKRLLAKGKIARIIEAGRLSRPARWMTTEAARKGMRVSQEVRMFLSKNPNSTSSYIAKSTGLAYNRVTSIMCNLATRKEVVAEGAGGLHDPYRYSLISGVKRGRKSKTAS
jgi:hypothetical protein